MLVRLEMSFHRPDPASRNTPAARSRSLFAAAGVYSSWIVATWLLEKRVGLFMRYDPAGRTLYALIANVGIGTVVASVAARWANAGTAGDPVQARTRETAPWRARPFALLLTAVLGALIVTKLAPPAAREPIVLVNAFAQILPTSIAEVITCWLLVGGAVQQLVGRRGPAPSTILAIVVGDVAFAVYHVAHSAPFDRPEMMAFLALPGLITGILVLVVRDRALAILVQNFFAMIGITKSADVEVFRHPFVWAYAVAAVATIAAFVALRESDRAMRIPRRLALRRPGASALGARSA